MAKTETKKKEGIVKKAYRYSNYVDYGAIAAGAVIGSAGLVSGGVLGVTAAQVIKGLRNKKKK